MCFNEKGPWFIMILKVKPLENHQIHISFAKMMQRKLANKKTRPCYLDHWYAF